jgi:hypothetical protein
MIFLSNTPSWYELFQAQTGQRGLLAEDAKTFSLGIAEQGEDYYTVLSPDSQPLVRLYSMEDLKKRLDKAGMHEPIKVK